MIELVRAFLGQADQLDVPIAIVAFGAEEYGAIGSRAWVETHAATLDQIRAVVDLDTRCGAEKGRRPG